MFRKMFISAPFLAIFIIALVSGCVQEQPIGGEKDEHGCLGTAGYTWDEEVHACIRDWELNENQKLAAEKAVDYLGYETGITVINVAVARCPGCFVVEVEKGRDRIKVTLDNWEILDKSLTPDECISRGGRTQNTVGGDLCNDNETNIGDVTGFISPNICCLPKMKACTESGGTVATSLCCKSVDDFPDNCAIGACGCAPDQSHEVKVCNCGGTDEMCWNGATCVLRSN